jgi:hypothetical protein
MNEQQLQTTNYRLLTRFWEIPLAFLSFVFYKAMKFIIGNIYTIYLAIAKEKSSQWRVLSAETLKSFLSLPVLMTKGPRWNTHAIIGTLGPFSVRDAIAIDTESANRSAASWIAVIYSFPGYKTIASIESDRLESQEKWVSLSLKPGKYSIGLRYYSWTNNVNLPAIQVDDSEFVKPFSVPLDNNDFYYDLIKRKNGFYLALHYYIFTILQLRKWLPKSFIRNEYLPVGAPNTEFFYNYLLKEQLLQLEIDDSLVNSCDIYLTVYDRSSLPLYWSRIESEKFMCDRMENNGYYLIRLRPKLRGVLVNDLAIQSHIEDEDSLVQRLRLFGKETK